jgi:alpha-tubulin suppressor-like RCC1 family protein
VLSPTATATPLPFTGQAVTAGSQHTCALTSTGGVKCWGLNDYGQLGDGTVVSRNTPVDVSGLGAGVVAVSGGGRHTCALTSAGGVKCWGRNNYGQLGDGTLSDRHTPVDVSGLTSGVTAISAGGYHTCALLSSGAVKCWGRNNRGQLGDGTTTNRSAAVNVGGLAGAIAVSAGGSDLQGGHTCALTGAGGAKCWGRNDLGQLGDGTTSDRHQPTDVAGLGSGTAEVHAGRYHSCARTNSGAVKCWGWNISGQLGNGTTTTSNVPVDVIGLQSDVTSLAAGGLHSCATSANGGARCWGANTSGQLGDGTTSMRSKPVSVLQTPGGPPLLGIGAVAAGGSLLTDGHTCAVMTAGGIKCWGLNGSGQVGDGTTTRRTTPVDVAGLAPDPTPTPTSTTPGDTATPTETPTDTATATETPVPSATPTPTDTPLPTATPTPTDTPTPIDTPTPTDTPTATATPTSTDTPGPTATPAVPDAVLYFALLSSGTVGGVSVANEDIVAWDGAQGFSLLFDGSDVGLAGFGIDAFAVLPNGELLLSFTDEGSVPGISGTVDDSDVVKFTSTSLGDNTSGAFALYFDGSDVGLTGAGEDVDAVELLPNGHLLLSVVDILSVTGLSADDEDIVEFSPSSLGAATAGTWSLYFDGSDVGLSTTSSEDVDALALDAAGKLYLSTLGDFSVTGIAGADDDVFIFDPVTLGTTTSGAHEPSLFFDGSAHGLGPNDLIAIDLPE